MTPLRITPVLGIGSLAACALACAFAWWLGDSRGLGWSAGFLSGAGLSLWGTLYQRQLLRSRAGDPLRAFVVAFLVKLFVIFTAALCVRFVPALRERVDLVFLLIAFPAGVVTVHTLSFAEQWLRLQRPARST